MNELKNGGPIFEMVPRIFFLKHRQLEIALPSRIMYSKCSDEKKSVKETDTVAEGQVWSLEVMKIGGTIIWAGE